MTFARVEQQVGGRLLSIETGKWARQADGSVVVRYGDTMVLATAQGGTPREDIDFFPLTVDYREKAHAAGKFPGGFFKREGRPTTREILVSRLIDRSLRPLFPDGFNGEVQVMSQVIATDQENDPDILAMIASFAAVHLSSIPFRGALGACRIGMEADGTLVVNPQYSKLIAPSNLLNLTVAAHPDAIVMVEAGAKNVKESAMIEAMEKAHQVCAQMAQMIAELGEKAAKTKAEFVPPVRKEELDQAARDRFFGKIRAAATGPGGKHDRKKALDATKKEFAAAFPAPAGLTEKETKAHNGYVGKLFGELNDTAEREAILSGRRSDGRDTLTIRPITGEVGVVPRVHGSALFTRGETQALVITTLGSVDDEQIIDGLFPELRKKFLLHYNFPPFSVGEVKRLMGPGRREIGHGALAERAVESVLPDHSTFPYTIRLTSEILESNGSSSMATVCGSTMALMDAGVPITQPVAGIAMGLVKEGNKIAILSDILGSEDHCGDMDFKVAGTQYGITALQMDIKCSGLTREIMERALEQAREGRLHILRKMLATIRRPRSEISPFAPRLEQIKINPEKIGLIIGPGGKNIRAMQEEFQVKIAIEDDGSVTIAGNEPEKVKECVARISAMTAEVEPGRIYLGKVTSIKEFGAFIEVLPGQEGLCHVSELSDEFVRSVTDVVRIGDEVSVKVLFVDEFGKIKLSRKAALHDQKGGPPAERPREHAGPASREVAAPEGEAASEVPAVGGEERPRDFGRPEGGPPRDRGGRPDDFRRGDRGDRDRGDRGRYRDRDRGGRPFGGGRDRDDRPGSGYGRHRDDRGRGEDRPREDRGPSTDDRGFRPERAPRDDRGFAPREPGHRDRDRGADRGPREHAPREHGHRDHGRRDAGAPEGPIPPREREEWNAGDSDRPTREPSSPRPQPEPVHETVREPIAQPKERVDELVANDFEPPRHAKPMVEDFDLPPETQPEAAAPGSASEDAGAERPARGRKPAGQRKTRRAPDDDRGGKPTGSRGGGRRPRTRR